MRVEYEGAVYHVTSRGNAGQDIYHANRDHQTFLEVLEQTVDRFAWTCHAYCLMTNHYHLLIETPNANLSKGMRHLNGVYTQMFNRRHGRTGHLLQGRFKSILVQKDSHLLELARYIVCNPVRAALVRDPADWPWSSYQGTAGHAPTPTFLTTQWVLSQFDTDPSRAMQTYAQFVAEGTQSGAWDDLHAGLLLGTDAFIENIKPLLQAAASATEAPRAQRFAYRPGLPELLPNSLPDKMARDEAIYRAARVYGYSLAEVAAIVGLHYSTVSVIARRMAASKRGLPR